MTISFNSETDIAANEDISLFPTSLAQQRLWFLYQLEPQSPAYNLTANMHLNMVVDVQALQASLNALLERHEVLRTSFVVDDSFDGLPMQMIIPNLTLSLPLVDLSQIPEPQRQQEVLCLANQEAQQTFDLGQAPLLRARLLKLAEQDFLLLLTFHHIISDGWSINVFFEELAALYNAFVHGQPSPLPPTPLQYVDFAIWQQEYMKNNGLSEHLVYWKQQLAGAPTTLDLPTDHPRPLSPSSRGSHYVITLPITLADALKTLSRQQGTTLYMTMVAAFQCLLFRYSAQEDLVLGTVASGRTLAGTESLLGFFVNTLVLRTNLSGNPTFNELLKRVREVILQADAHQEMPFDYLVKELQPERIPGQNPLFQVLLSLDPATTASSTSWIPGSIAGQTNTSKFDLSLELNDHSQGIDCTFEFSTDLFEEATIERMAGHWQTLLEGIVADSSRRLADLPLLTEQEHHQLLTTWNATQKDYPQGKSIHQFFEEQVERTPDAIALILGQQQMTYQELNRRANQLAHYLQELGVGPEVMVGVCVKRSIEMIVSLLGIFKAGGGYVPLDPEAPMERLAFQMEETQMPVLLTQESLLMRLPHQQIQLLCLDRDWDSIERYSPSNPISEVLSEQLAYVIYTSGSTGRPKGVLVEHGTLAAHCRAMAQIYELKAEDRVLQFSTTAFDASLEQILPTLLVGARLVIRGTTIWSPQQLLHQIQQEQLSVINLSPAYWQQVLQDWVQVPGRVRASSLRLVIVGGDQLPPEALRLWRRIPLHSVRVLNAYGPTETIITATVYNTADYVEDPISSQRVPIGRPLPNRTAYLLDKAGQMVPIGVTGELHLGGELLARGYLKRPELTTEHFIADPFSSEPNARLYRTGDLARYRSDGNIEVVGRVDQQVKIRGFRIEVGEIEAVLSQHPAVREVAVVVREDRPGEKSLVAYVVARPGQHLQSQQLRHFLQEKLPSYMLPAAYVMLEALPLLPTGKLNRQALPAPELTGLTDEENFVAPKLLIHQQLVQIWEELLDVRPIGIRDNFFYIGGHSLLAARLVDRIKHVFGKNIALSTLFSGPTIEQLADALQQQEGTDARVSLLPVQSGGSKQPLFFLHGDWTGGAFYCFTLGRVLGPDQPFYALEPYKFSGLRTLPSFEEVARAHVEAMRAIQPRGPYLLGGFCNGGLLAYEMARQLQAAGEQVDFLGLINPTPPVQFEALRKLNSRIGKFLPLNEKQQVNLLIRGRHALRHMYRLLHPSGDRVQDFDQLLAIDPRLNSMFPPIDALYNDYVGAFTGIMSRYETGVYSGRITFYWATEEPGIEDTWHPVTRAKNSEDIENYAVPGTHMSCVTDHIQELAQCFSSSLQKAEVDTQPEPKHISINS